MSQRSKCKLLGAHYSQSSPQASMLFLICMILSMFVSVAGAQSSTKPLSEDDVVQLLKGSVPSKRVGELAKTRGIDFQVTPNVEAELRQVGASDELLTTLRGLAPTERPNIPTSAPTMLVVQSTPGSAHVYVDDQSVGTTSHDHGILKVSTVAGQHRVRCSLDGYQDLEHLLEPRSGEVIESNCVLVPNQKVEPPQNKKEVALYICRLDRLTGSALPLSVYCDGDLVTQVSNGGYAKASLSAGKHECRLTWGIQNPGEYPFELELAVGNTYYFQTSGPGFWALKGIGFTGSLIATRPAYDPQALDQCMKQKPNKTNKK